MTTGPEHSIVISRHHILHRFKLRQNSTLSVLDFNFLSALPTSSLPKLQYAPVRFLYFFLRSFNFQRIVSNTARKHQFASLFSIFSPQFYRPKHRFRQRQNAPFSVLDFKLSQQFRLTKHCFKQRQNTPFSVLDFNIFHHPKKNSVGGERTPTPVIILFRVN